MFLGAFLAKEPMKPQESRSKPAFMCSPHPLAALAHAAHQVSIYRENGIHFFPLEIMQGWRPIPSFDNHLFSNPNRQKQ